MNGSYVVRVQLNTAAWLTERYLTSDTKWVTRDAHSHGTETVSRRSSSVSVSAWLTDVLRLEVKKQALQIASSYLDDGTLSG
jgi:hypothetical protein